MTPGGLVAEYLPRLPAEHVAGSCLFHGAVGCTLPRQMRSQVCNRHLCQEVKAVRDGLPHNPRRFFVAAATSDEVATELATVGTRSGSADGVGGVGPGLLALGEGRRKPDESSCFPAGRKESSP